MAGTSKDESPPERCWRPVRTKPKSEHLAAAHLGRHEGVEVFCPRVRFRRATRRGMVWFVEALFPGYVLARFEVGESLRVVNAAPHVLGVVRFGDEHPPVPDSLVAQLREEFEDGGEPLVVEQVVRVGDEVEVASGPFRGQQGEVTGLRSGAERVRILLEFLGQQREVEVPIAVLLGLRDPRFPAPPGKPG